MQITITYDSIWQNSFLAGDDSKPLSKENKRGFIATSKSKDHVLSEINKNTVMGILCRLIGCQGKLYQLRENKDYYFKGIEDLISFEIGNEQVTEETTFIVNKSDNRPAQSTFIGVIPDTTELFFSDSAPQLWSVLYLNFDELMDFILGSLMCEAKGSSMPKDLLARIEDILNTNTATGVPVKTVERERNELSEKIDKEKLKQKKLKESFYSKKNPTVRQKEAFEKRMGKFSETVKGYEEEIIKIQKSADRARVDKKLKAVIEILGKKFPDQSYLENGMLYRMSLYAVALYLQVERMIQSNIPIDYCLNSKREISIQGFSKRGFNSVRDFLNRIAGGKKKTVGTPFPLSKASGKLEIIIDINRDKAKELKQMIENAGVSSFYLGKKGLAYLSDDIITKEVGH